MHQTTQPPLDLLVRIYICASVLQIQCLFLQFSACDDGWQPYNPRGLCYKHFTEFLTWSEALEQCQAAAPNSGGDLASIPDEDTNEFLQSLTPKEADVWVGGHRSSGNGEEWMWSDGTSWQFNNWFQGQPDNLGGVQTHLSFNFDNSGHWDDDFAFEEKSFLCSHKGLLHSIVYY